MKAISYIKMLRPAQWLKNLMLLFPPFLGGTLFQAGIPAKLPVPLISFCLASSSAYIVNDILDAANDARHPVKRGRPVASGEVPVTAAVIGALLLAAGAVSLALKVSGLFSLLLVVYLLISFTYSVKLKELPLVDIFCIAAGFLLRLNAGGEASGVVISDWLFLTVFLLAVFLSTGKRLGEKNTLGDFAAGHRKSLLTYPDGFLEGMMYMTGAAVLVTYTMYVIAHHALVYTVPLCTFGLLRYIYLVKSGISGDPTNSLLQDRVLFCVGFLWTVMVGWGIYGK